MPSSEDTIYCPLCGLGNPADGLVSQDNRFFTYCSRCKLIYCDPNLHPDHDRQRRHYDTHQNSPEDSGYRHFLSRAMDPVKEEIDSGKRVLDFGCGPASGIAAVLGEKGIGCEVYDPIYHPELPSGAFDFIFCTEVFEHLHQPADTVQKLREMLVDGGKLVVMSECWTDLNRFPTWYYTRDETHVCFWHEHTFRYLADAFRFEIGFSDRRRVFVLEKRT